ncbi:MAG: amidohydrolase family protein [Syntrophobacter sp.]
MGTVFSLLAGWLIDGSGSPAADNMLIRIEDGIISSLDHVPSGPATGSSAPGCADLSNCTIIPSLVDSHVHLTLSGSIDQALRHDQLHYTFDRNAPLIAGRVARYLSFGILALRDGGDRSGDSLRYNLERMAYGMGFSAHSPSANPKSRDKRPTWPAQDAPIHLKTPGSAWRANGRYGSMIGNPPEPGLTLAQSILLRTDPIDHVKIINSGLNSLTEFGKQTPPQFSREEIQAAVKAARQHGLKTMVHANGTAPVADALEAGCSSIEHGFFMGRENMLRMADLQTFWVPTAYSMKALRENTPSTAIESRTAARNLDQQLDQISRARSLGVRIALGTDAGGFGLHHAESFIEEFKLFKTAGFSTEEAVRCSSMEGALLLGLDAEMGSIRVGMPATFVVLNGHPSLLPDSLHNVRTVYVRGETVHA